jgi:hypothetical protein
MALAVFSTGCAVDATDDGEEDTTEVQATIVVNTTVSLGSGKAGQPVSSPLRAMSSTPTPSPAPGSRLDQVADPLPEPWHPGSRVNPADTDDSDLLTVSTTTDRSGDHK